MTKEEKKSIAIPGQIPVSDFKLKGQVAINLVRFPSFRTITKKPLLATSLAVTMVSERGIRTSHTVLFALILIASIITLAISASLVSHYNGDGYPMYHTTAYKERIRILLVASVWTVVFGSTSLLSTYPGCIY